MTRLLLLLGALVLLVGGVTVPATATTSPVDNTVILYDTFGQRLDAHDGDVLQGPDGRLWLYGTGYGCGFRLGTPSPYCGVRVYTTTDLRTFTPAGAVGGLYAFDHLGADWQGLCAASSTRTGCFRPHVVQRPSDGRYVMWLNTGGTPGYVTLVADQPAGPFTQTGVTPVLAVDPGTGLRWGDEDVTIAPDGRGYLTYTVIDPVSNAHTLVIEQLDPTLTTGTGRYVVTDTTIGGPDMAEAPGLFYGPNGAWYLIYSQPAGPYQITSTGILNGPRGTADPIGTYTSPRALDPDSCSGQPTGAWPIHDAAGSLVVVYGTDRWDQTSSNQAKANNYYGALTFTAVTSDGYAIDAYACQTTWTL